MRTHRTVGIPVCEWPDNQHTNKISIDENFRGVNETMAKYKIAWLPGDGVGNDVMECARKALDALQFDAEYLHGDIGWEFWKHEGEALPQRGQISRAGK